MAVRNTATVAALYERPLLSESTRGGRSQTAPTAAARVSQWLIIAIVAFLPFELRAESPYPSQLQVLFFLLVIASLPLVVRNARSLISNRLVVAVLIFAAIQWACAFIAVDFGANTVKAALR